MRDAVGRREGSVIESGWEELFPTVLYAKTLISHLLRIQDLMVNGLCRKYSGGQRTCLL